MNTAHYDGHDGNGYSVLRLYDNGLCDTWSAKARCLQPAARDAHAPAAVYLRSFGSMDIGFTPLRSSGIGGGNSGVPFGRFRALNTDAAACRAFGGTRLCASQLFCSDAFYMLDRAPVLLQRLARLNPFQ